ncbi:SDR family oxidoreductase [Nocardia sp. CA-128927]|uniref:SDR family oxidoreductase n=1 Tax=Nocardia sp. CA-128927 TaxID=3239975 RepID=UPI003D97D06A
MSSGSLGNSVFTWCTSASGGVNAIQPGIINDTASWDGNTDVLESISSRTPTGRLVTTADIVDATAFLIRNPALNRVNLTVDGGMM